MNEIRCISVEVFQGAMYGDCTNSGISSRYPELLVACPDGPEAFDADVSVPLNFCVMKKRRIYGDTVYSIVPAMVEDGIIKERGDGRWYMMGGNFGYSSDARFSYLCRGMYGAVAIHDRWEGRWTGRRH